MLPYCTISVNVFSFYLYIILVKYYYEGRNGTEKFRFGTDIKYCTWVLLAATMLILCTLHFKVRVET